MVRIYSEASLLLVKPSLMSGELINQTVGWSSSPSFPQTGSSQQFPTLPLIVCDICLPVCRHSHYISVLFLCHFKQLFPKGVCCSSMISWTNPSPVPHGLRLKASHDVTLQGHSCYPSAEFHSSDDGSDLGRLPFSATSRPPAQNTPVSSLTCPLSIQRTPRFPCLLILLSSPANSCGPNS